MDIGSWVMLLDEELFFGFILGETEDCLFGTVYTLTGLKV